jgi:Zn-dependent protease
MGRVTFNPLRHIDPFGTVLLPAMLALASGGRMIFGFAKPVPVNFGRLKRPRWDSVLVAGAGPGVNLLLALAAAVLLRWMPPVEASIIGWVTLSLINLIWINVLLAVFNLLPLPPLDGGRIAVAVLPRSLALPLARIERYGMWILLGAIFLLPTVGRAIGIDLDVFQWLVLRPTEWLSDILLGTPRS